MEFELRLYQDRLPAKAATAPLPDGPAVRAWYVVEGAVRIRAAGAVVSLAANSAWHAAETGVLSQTAAAGDAANHARVGIAAGHVPTLLLRWELVRAGAPRAALRGDGVASVLALAAHITLPESERYLLRCDRVDFPPRGEALTHTHRGPGIRCLLRGNIRIDTQGASHEHGPLEPWFEAGPDPVYAAASAEVATAFARVMILPRDLLGASSIRYVRPEDLQRPKSQSYQIFIDEPIELPRDS
jgi:hypothetical protein